MASKNTTPKTTTAGPDTPDSSDPEGLQARIEHTRGELGGTIEELMEKTDLKAHAHETADHALAVGRRNAKPLAAAGGAALALAAAGLLARHWHANGGNGGNAGSGPARAALGGAGRTAGKLGSAATGAVRRTAGPSAKAGLHGVKGVGEVKGMATAVGAAGKSWYGGLRHGVSVRSAVPAFLTPHWYDTVPGSTAAAYRAGKAVGTAKRAVHAALH